MKKSTLFIIISVIVIIGLVGFYFFLQTQNESGNASKDKKFLGIFPLGEDGENGGVANDNTEDTNDLEELDENSVMEEPLIPRFRQISSGKVSGFKVFEKEGASTTIMFIERDTGHIFKAQTDDLKVERISNTTIPKIREVFWFNNEDSLVIRYLDAKDTIKSFVANIKKEEDGSYSLESEILPNNITSGDTHNDLFVSVVEDLSGSSIKTYNNNAEENLVLVSPLKEWLIDAWGTRSVSIQNKPSYIATSNLYFLNTTSGSLTKIISGIRGLTSKTSPDGSFVFYSSGGTNSLSSYVYDVEKEETISLSVSSLGDKCTWDGLIKIYCGVPSSVNGRLPDDWYKGLVSFNDSIWSIDIESGIVKNILVPEEEGVSIDIIKPEVVGDFLYFINKKDSSFWSLMLGD